MSSVEFNVVNGSPRIVRTTNVPSYAAGTWCGWFKITSYENWGELLSWGLDGDEYCFLEFDVSGTLYLITRNTGAGGGTVLNFWTDGYAGWVFVALTSNGTNFTAYRMKEADIGVMTTVGTTPPNTFTPTHIALGAYDIHSTPGGEGTILVCGLKAYDRTLSSAELITEATSLTPVDTANLTFANDGQSASLIYVDQSGTDGDFTLTGTPTLSADTPSGLNPPAPPAAAPPASTLFFGCNL